MLRTVTQLSRIQILDEREQGAVKYCQTRVCFALEMYEGNTKVGQLEDYPMLLHPDANLQQACEDVSTILTAEGFSPVPANAIRRCQLLCEADYTPLMKARWKVNSAKEALTRLGRMGATPEVAAMRGLAEGQLLAAKAELQAIEGPVQVGRYQETRFNLLTVLPDGQLEVRLRKCICQNGEVINPAKYHRFVLHPGIDYAYQMAAVNEHLPKLDAPFPPLAISDMARIARLCAVEHTPAVILAYKEVQARARTR